MVLSVDPFIIKLNNTKNTKQTKFGNKTANKFVNLTKFTLDNQQ